MKNLQVAPITYEMARQLVKPLKVRNANEVANALIQAEFKKRGLEKWMKIRLCRYTNKALKKLVDAGGGGQQFRQDQRKLQRTIRENQVYAVLCPDNENYYRTIFLKKNFVGNLVPAISNAIYGVVPDGIDVVAPEAVTKYLRQNNLTNFNAGVFSSASVPPQPPSTSGMVSALHQSLQSGTGRWELSDRSCLMRTGRMTRLLKQKSLRVCWKETQEQRGIPESKEKGCSDCKRERERRKMISSHHPKNGGIFSEWCTNTTDLFHPSGPGNKRVTGSRQKSFRGTGESDQGNQIRASTNKSTIKAWKKKRSLIWRRSVISKQEGSLLLMQWTK